jgi:hypothetical protein
MSAVWKVLLVEDSEDDALFFHERSGTAGFDW